MGLAKKPFSPGFGRAAGAGPQERVEPKRINVDCGVNNYTVSRADESAADRLLLGWVVLADEKHQIGCMPAWRFGAGESVNLWGKGGRGRRVVLKEDGEASVSSTFNQVTMGRGRGRRCSDAYLAPGRSDRRRCFHNPQRRA